MTKTITVTKDQLSQLVNYAVEAALKSHVKSVTKPSKKAPAETNADGKTDRQLKTEIAVVRAFKKAGYGTVTPRVDVQTYNRWLAEGYKVKTGEKSIKVGPFRLFHKKQVEYVGHSPKSEGLTDAQIAEFRQVNAEASGEASST